MDPVLAALGLLFLIVAIYQTATGKTFKRHATGTEKIWMILGLYLFALVLFASSLHRAPATASSRTESIDNFRSTTNNSSGSRLGSATVIG